MQQVAAFFDMDEYTLRRIDDTWSFSALLRLLHLDGMYIMGALVLIGGFGWISIGEKYMPRLHRIRMLLLWWQRNSTCCGDENV